MQYIYIYIKALASARGSAINKKKADSPKRACQCLYMFFTTESKKSNLMRRFNHVLINQIEYNFTCSFIHDILEGCKNFKEI